MQPGPHPLALLANYVTAFDGVIVIISLMETIGSGSSAVTAPRGFRPLREVKLAKKWDSFRLLLRSIMGTVLEMWDFVCLLFLIIFVFTLMGQSFFATKFLFDDHDHLVLPENQELMCPIGLGDIPTCLPRAHFDDFLLGYVTIFQILNRDNWNAVMYDGVKACVWYFCSYFILVVVAGTS